MYSITLQSRDREQKNTTKALMLNRYIRGKAETLSLTIVDYLNSL